MSSNKIEEFLQNEVAETHENQILIKKVRANVDAMRYKLGHGNCWSLKVHQTEILQYLPEGLLLLNSGGYKTAMTKKNANQFLPEGWVLKSVSKNWFLIGPNQEGKTSSYPFVDEMLIDPNTREVFYPAMNDVDRFLPYSMVPLAYHHAR